MFSEKKTVHVYHKNQPNDFSLEIKGNVIIFNSIEWANDILGSIGMAEMSYLDVTFLDSATHASQEVVEAFLPMILTKYAPSIRVLKLRGLDHEFFSLIEFHPENGLLFPRLTEITLSETVITRHVLEMFSHVKVLRIYDPFRMNFGPKQIKHTTNIPFNNLVNFILIFNDSNSRIGKQYLPIESTTIQGIRIYDKYHKNFDDKNNFIVIKSLPRMINLNTLKIKGGAKGYSIQKLNKFPFKNLLTKLILPIKDTINVFRSKVKEVEQFICTAHSLTQASFLLDHLPHDKQLQFAQYKDKTIACKKPSQARFEVFFYNISNAFMEFTVRKIFQ